MDVEASWGHRSDAYAYASRDYTRVVTKVTSWKKLTKQQVFVSQLTQFPRSVHHRLTFSQDVTVCDKFKNVISVPFDFMNKIPISRSTNGCSRKKSRCTLEEWKHERNGVGEISSRGRKVGLPFTGVEIFSSPSFKLFQFRDIISLRYFCNNWELYAYTIRLMTRSLLSLRKSKIDL